MKTLPCLLTAVTAVIVTGCGGGSSSPSTNPSITVSSDITAGVSALNTAATTPSATPSTAVTSALTSFTAARAAVNSSTPAGVAAQANVGYSLTQAAMTAYQIQTTLGLTALRSASRSSSTNPAQNTINRLAFWNGSLFATGKIQHASDIIPVKWILGLASSSTRSTGVTAANIKAALQAVYTPGSSTGLINQVLAGLTTANIQALETTPFTFQYLDSQGTTHTILFGSAEAYALRGVAEAVAALVDMTLSYNFDPGSFDFNAQTVFSGTTLTATSSAFLPPSPFGTLNSNGASLMADSLSKLQASLTDESTALTVSGERTSTTGWLAALLIGTQSVSQMQTDLATAQSTLSGTPLPVTFASPNGSVGLNLNVAAWFNSPPSDLKAFFSTLNSDGFEITVQSSSISDPTFDGLFSPAVPSSVLYSNVYFGYPVSNSTAAGIAGVFDSL